MQCSNSSDTVKLLFNNVVIRLKSVNNWESLSDKVKAGFHLIDPETKLQTDRLETGIFVSIAVPGISNPSGNGYDWTRIIYI